MTEPRKFFAGRDGRKLALILGSVAIALLPSRSWLATARRVAALATRSAGIEGHIPATIIRRIEERGASAGAVLAANHLVEGAQVMRHFMPWHWQPRFTLVGRENLDAALKGGRGALLWIGDFASSNVVPKMALWRSGYEVTHVARGGHPHSDSRFGQAVLDRPQVVVENRYLAGGRILLEEPGALRRVYTLLAQNNVVSIKAGTAALRTTDAPFLGGTPTIALGPPHIAATSGAPLLPVFCVQRTPDDYEVHVLASLPSAQDRDFKAVAEAFAEALEKFVSARPEQWQGWEAVRPGADGSSTPPLEGSADPAAYVPGTQ